MPVTKIGKTLLIAGFALGSSVAVAQDKPATMTGASDSMLANTCAGCHGTNGASGGPAAPTIAGMSEEYLVEVMQGFASGAVPSTIMDRIAKGYSEGEIKQLAKFYAGQSFVAGKQGSGGDAATGAKLHDKYCEKCHAEGGTSAEDDAGILKGQWRPYLEWTLADYLAGTREPTKKMKKKLEELSEDHGDAGWTALLDYYASDK